LLPAAPLQQAAPRLRARLRARAQVRPVPAWAPASMRRRRQTAAGGGSRAGRRNPRGRNYRRPLPNSQV
jgi:hypothetical protein